MTVKELIEILSEYDDDTPVYKDGLCCDLEVEDTDGCVIIY